MGDILLFPVIPEIILAIPLSNSPNDKKLSPLPILALQKLD